MRMIGGGLAFGGCLFLGGRRERELARQRRALEGAAEELERMALRLEWNGAPLGELLDWMAQREGPLRQVYLRCGAELTQADRPAFGAVWQEAVEAETTLPPAGTALLTQAGELLGQYHHQRQEEGLRALSQRLREEARQTEARRAQLGRVYWVTGGAAGLLLVLLLM